MADIQADTGVDAGVPSAPPSSPAPSTPSGDTGFGGPEHVSPSSHPGSSRKTVRESLNEAVEQHSEPVDGFERARQRKGLADETETPVEKPKRAKAEKTDGQTDTGTDTGTRAVQSAAQPGATQPPAAWAKDAKEAWSSAAPAIQAAVLKREQDVEKGVLALREYYKEIDSTLQQYDRQIKEVGLPPGKIVNNLFGWMNAIHSNPVESIPALMASYNFNHQTAAQILEAVGNRYFPEDIALLKKTKAQLRAKGQKPAQGQAQQQEPQPPQVHPDVIRAFQAQQAEQQRMREEFAREIHGIRGVFQSQSQAQTDAYLADWAKDKPYFADVRGHMARLLMPETDPRTGQVIGPPIIPFKNGRVDLDAAYDYAIHAIPEIRAKVLAAQQEAAAAAAQNKAKNEAAAHAKAAAEASRKRVSVTTTAPGGNVVGAKPPRGQSVRQSIEEARKQVSQRGRV